MPPKAAQPDLEPVQDFLAERGIESLAGCPVMGHDGEPVTLAEALASCEPARRSIDRTIALSKKYNGDVLTDLKESLEEMGEEAQETTLTPETAGAEKK
jgi:hypothetical protein